MGIAGLIFGILAAISSMLPKFIANFVATPGAIIGIILCAVAFSKARVENTAFGAALAGLLLSFAALM